MFEQCRNIIMSEDYADFMYAWNEIFSIPIEEAEDKCIQPLGSVYISYHLPLSDISEFKFSNYRYSSIPKLYGLMDTLSLESSGIISVRNQPAMGLTGKGVMIGIIDTGIDYMNDVFINEDGNSKIAAIWDQTALEGTLPRNMLFGAEYTNEMINYAIRQENPYDYVPSRDEIGHGTVLASVAAGNVNIVNDFQGAAPEAMLGIVKLKPAKKYLRDFFLIQEDAIAYQENDIILGIRYLDTLALSMQMPLVICLGVGTNMGAHTGDNYLSRVAAWLARIRERAIVVATGNEANTRHHYFSSREENTEYDEIEIRAGGESFIAEIWGQAPDVLSVSVTSPTGETIPRIPVGVNEGGEYDFIFDASRVEIDYKIIEESGGRQLILIRFITPTQGIWRIRVYYTSVIQGVINMWLPIRGFITEDTFVLESNPYITLTEPSATPDVLTVGGYNYLNNSIDINSGRGFNANNAVKPDIVAPSQNVFAARVNNRYGNAEGTSVAAAITSGAAAMLFEWGVVRGNQPDMNSEEIKTILIRGARRRANLRYPNREWGYGELDLLESFRQLQLQ